MNWADLEPNYRQLQDTPISAGNVDEWLAGWSRISECVDEIYNRLIFLTTSNTANPVAEAQFNNFLDQIYPQAMAAEQVLKEKLLLSHLTPAGFEIPLRNMQMEADLFREKNLPLLSQEQKLCSDFDKIIGAQTIEWEGKEETTTRMTIYLQDPDRSLRERVFRLISQRELADREAIDRLWAQMIDLRLELAANAGKPDYRAFRWQQLLRVDYTPADCRHFHQAIEQVVVPAARRILERRKARLGVETLRPWDLDVDPGHSAPLQPFSSIAEYVTTTGRIFHQVDPVLGGYFQTMVDEDLLDLENRKNKAPGAYTTAFTRVRKPLIFANAIGCDDDLRTLFHESGHAFNFFESASLPYLQQINPPMEFAEVASQAMELLARPYITRDRGGFYDPPEAARSMIDQLERIVLFWPYMAVVDAFQHWVYENPQAARDGKNCDQTWGELWQRFMPVTDWSGLEAEMATGWQRKHHIHQEPFYYVEYGMAQLGACQIWANSLSDPKSAVADYRKALALGGTRPLPELYQAAGARLAFDADALRQSIDLIESTLADLSAISYGV